MRQILVNLVANAVRHSPECGTVRLAATIADEHAQITVSDDGPGFDLAEVSGQGLGLHLVQAVAAAHGGSVEVSRDNGARVEVTIPSGRD